MLAAALAACVLGGAAAGRAGVRVADRFAGVASPSRSRAPRRRRLAVQEPVTAAACAAVVWRFGTGWAMVPPLVAAVSLVLLAAVDLRTYRLPDAVNAAALAAGLAAVAAESFAAGRPGTVWVSAAAGAGYFAALWAARAVRPAALGFGDVKLAPVLGVHLGWTAAAFHRSWDAAALVAFSLLIGCLLGVALALAVFLLRRRGLDPLPDPERAAEAGAPARLLGTVIPFGPALAAGTLAAMVLSEALLP